MMFIDQLQQHHEFTLLSSTDNGGDDDNTGLGYAAAAVVPLVRIAQMKFELEIG